LAICWVGSLRTSVRIRLLEGLRVRSADTTWEKYFTLVAVEVGAFVTMMESIDGAVRLEEMLGKLPSEFTLRYAIKGHWRNFVISFS